jgi:type II secretory pathway predicted ATPase ExeA/cell division protein FtsN
VSINYSKSLTSRSELDDVFGAVVPFQSHSAALTYEPFFGLSEKPFSLTADPRFVYASPAYVAACESLLAGIRRREGLLVLTGEIGTGKTTLCRGALKDLGRETYVSLVPDPFASREDLLKMLLIDFGVSSIQEVTTGTLRGASRTELGYLLSAFLESLSAEAFAIVIIDEAQNLSLPLIEETRILSDTFGVKGRLQIVFVGQPELHTKLKLPEMRQVDQRVSGYHRLAPMSRDAVAGYIQHRLQVAGASRDRVLFAPAIVDVIHQRCGGVPRLINRACDRALQIAFERKADAVSREILDVALSEVRAATPSPTWDSTVFAAPAPAAAPTPAVAVAASTPAPAPPVMEFESDLDEAEHFEKQIDHWVEKDLAPPSRRLTTIRAFADETAVPERKPVESRPAMEHPPAPATARKTAAPARTVTSDWSRDAQQETYVQRLRRVWGKRVAIAAGVFVAVNAAIAGGLFLFNRTQATPPATVNAPAPAKTSVAIPAKPKAAPPAAPAAAPAATPADAPAVAEAAAPRAAAADTAVASNPVAKPAVADSGEYLVAVGLFANREGADQLVDTLTKAGLPAMQRPYHLRQRQLQQIVLGPFFTRSEAAAELRRLQGLGGYNDATVITGSVATQQP